MDERNCILLFNKKRGFPGMFASWDCSHFKWDKCPVKYHGAYKSRYNNSKTVVLECVVDCYMWIWYMNFGNAGSLNDINILDKSSIVSSIWSGKFDLKCPSYKIHNLVCDYMYFLVDGIYPPWSIFMNTIRVPLTDNEKRYSKQQEGCRKDVERVFAILQNKFQILKNALRIHKIEDINNIVHCCIILHNMMVEKRMLDENDEVVVIDDVGMNPTTSIFSNLPNVVVGNHETDFYLGQQIADRVAQMAENLKNEELHVQMKNSLVMHMASNRNNIEFYK
jgi:hypothetical protein